MKVNKTRELNPYILIVCEGTQTEKNYFKSFHVPALHIEVYGKGQSTCNLVEYTQTLKNQRENELDIEFDYVWCVFDRDRCCRMNYDLAYRKAREYKFKIAFSVEAFEVWLLLHFMYFLNQYSVQDLEEKLSIELKKERGIDYDKADPNIYEYLEDRMKTALNNAKRLHRYHSPGPQKSHYDCNPFSTVFELVEFLISKEQ
ncbi:RloB family protein [bacterium]|nr:RloB family protein [bacterium]